MVTCCERANLLVLLCVMFFCAFVTFPCGFLGQVWYLIVSIPDLVFILTFNTMEASNLVKRGKSEKCRKRDRMEFGIWGSNISVSHQKRLDFTILVRYLRQEFNLCNVHGIMNTSGLLQRLRVNFARDFKYS